MSKPGAPSTSAPVLKQRAIQDAIELRQRIKALEAEVTDLKAAYDRQKLILVHCLQRGDTIESGRARVLLTEKTRMEAVKWKEVFAQHAGPAAVERIMENAPRITTHELTFVLDGHKLA